ncbi:MAG: Tm-1-like ATP-binding domain-containing protein [Woeseiaceae bacterium]|jgi:uncharacterized protein (UPF0261 family)
MAKHIVLLCSLDTKPREADYLRECIDALGATSIVINIGYGRPARTERTISAAEVAAAASSDIDDVRSMKDTGAASTIMMQGAIICVQQLLLDGRCDGIVSFGGASNTTLATGVMKTVPAGIPKLVVSSAAGIPAYAAGYFGSRDITIMHSVVDLAGLNDLTRTFLKQGAGAICGMAEASDGPVGPDASRRLVAVSGFRFAETCCQATMAELEDRDYAVIPFHAQGVGENAMENLLAQGLFIGVVDIVPAGLSEHMFGGNRAARAERLEAAGRIGIPQVISTSGFDMISCGPLARRDNNDPLWTKRRLAERVYTVPDRFRVEARTTPEEVAEIGRAVAGKLNQASGPVTVVVPTKGWSSLSVEGADLYDPQADAALVPAMKSALNPEITVEEVDNALNTKSFGRLLARRLDEMIQDQNAGVPSA